MKQEFRLSPWRSIYDIAICWVVVAFSIALTLRVSLWFYPVSVVLIANRILALSLICHEGLHGNLSRNKKWNDFLGRYFCAFPTFISFSKYRRLHLLHHGGVGSETWDPDRHLYDFFPMDFKSYASRQLRELFTLRMMWGFIRYYTEIPELLQILRGRMRFSQLHKSSDLKEFLVYHGFLFTLLLFTGHNLAAFFFITVPLVFITQPYVLLIGGLQHGRIRSIDHPAGVSRTVRGSSWYMWLLLPLDINYHAEHHRHPSVPHYRLRHWSHHLEDSGLVLWKETYFEAVRDLFAVSKTASSGEVSASFKDS